jgi:hypothetical protein
MHPDLEAIVSADEEARARVEAADRDAKSRVDAVRAEVSAAREARRQALDDALAREVAAIVTEAEREAAAIGDRRAAYGDGGSDATQLIDRAVDLYVRIVRDGPAAERSG